MSDPKIKPIRSPSYPALPLRDAIDAVQKIESKYRTSVTDRGEAAKLIGFASQSGPANMALAALAAYGLVERAGKGEMRVTPRARDILYADSEPERVAAIQAAAREPKLYAELRDRFQDIPVPPYEGVINYLNKQSFNPTAVRPAAKAFLDTMAYVQELTASESHGSGPLKARESPPAADGAAVVQPVKERANLGDLVQWESNGILKLDSPKRVRWISDDGNWFAVEGSSTGMPMDQVLIEERAHAGSPNPPPEVPKKQTTLTERVNSEADMTGASKFRFKLGDGLFVDIRSEGELGEAELGKLVALLTAQQAVLKT